MFLPPIDGLRKFNIVLGSINISCLRHLVSYGTLKPFNGFP